MRILQVSIADVLGGAERVALDLHESYLKLGHESTLAVGFLAEGGPGIIEIPYLHPENAWERFWYGLSPEIAHSNEALPLSTRVVRALCLGIANPRRALRRILQTADPFEARTRWLGSIADSFDVVHLHNLSGGYFDITQLPQLCQRAPVVVTAHDRWLQTGRCAHPLDCEQWRQGCCPCPYPVLPPHAPLGSEHPMWLQKKSAYEAASFTLVCPSQWLASCFEDSMVLSGASQTLTIHNGIDAQVFTPSDEVEDLRVQLDIPHEAFICGFMIAMDDNPYKDVETLFEAFEIVGKECERPLVVMGIGQGSNNHATESYRLIHIPFTSQQSVLARYLSLCDVFVQSSVVESLPLSLMEAQACHVAVVATDVGGTAEAMRKSETGTLVASGDAYLLALAILELASDEKLRKDYGVAGRVFITQHRTRDEMARRYVELYETLRRSEK